MSKLSKAVLLLLPSLFTLAMLATRSWEFLYYWPAALKVGLIFLGASLAYGGLHWAVRFKLFPALHVGWCHVIAVLGINMFLYGVRALFLVAASFLDIVYVMTGLVLPILGMVFLMKPLKLTAINGA